MLQFGLRLGDRPGQIITTTPRPLPLVKALMAEGLIEIAPIGYMRGRTLNNAFIVIGKGVVNVHREQQTRWSEGRRIVAVDVEVLAHIAESAGR